MSQNSNCAIVVHNFVTNNLPSTLFPYNIYFVKVGGSIQMYVTDMNSTPYLIGGSGGDITLTSPNGTIAINGYGIDVSPSVLNSIITLHNNFPDLQGGTWHLTEEQHTRVLELIYQNNTVTFSNSPLTGERGLSTPITLTYNLDSNDDTITSASINQGVGNITSGIDQGSQNISGGNRVNNTAYVLTYNYDRNGQSFGAVKNTTYTTYIPQWSGLSASETLQNEGYVQFEDELNKVVQSGDTISIDVAPTNQYVWFISTNANATITNNGFNTIIGEWGGTYTFILENRCQPHFGRWLNKRQLNNIQDTGIKVTQLTKLHDNLKNG